MAAPFKFANVWNALTRPAPTIQTFRLIAPSLGLSVLAEGFASWRQINVSFFVCPSFAFSRRSPPLVLRFCDGVTAPGPSHQPIIIVQPPRRNCSALRCGSDCDCRDRARPKPSSHCLIGSKLGRPDAALIWVACEFPVFSGLGVFGVCLRSKFSIKN